MIISFILITTHSFHDVTISVPEAFSLQRWIFGALVTWVYFHALALVLVTYVFYFSIDIVSKYCFLGIILVSCHALAFIIQLVNECFLWIALLVRS